MEGALQGWKAPPKRLGVDEALASPKPPRLPEPGLVSPKDACVVLLLPKLKLPVMKLPLLLAAADDAGKADEEPVKLPVQHLCQSFVQTGHT